MSWGDGLSTGVDSRASLTLNRRFGSHHFRPANFPHARRRRPGCRSVGASPASAHTLGRLLAVRRDIEVTRSRAFNWLTVTGTPHERCGRRQSNVGDIARGLLQVGGLRPIPVNSKIAAISIMRLSMATALARPLASSADVARAATMAVRWVSHRRTGGGFRGAAPAARPLPRQRRGKLGVRRGSGATPRQPLPGTREAWPQGVGWLKHLSPHRRCGTRTRPSAPCDPDVTTRAVLRDCLIARRQHVPARPRRGDEIPIFGSPRRHPPGLSQPRATPKGEPVTGSANVPYGPV